MTDAPATVGLDLGGTKILGMLVSPEGTPLNEARRPTPTDADGIVDALSAMAGELGAGPTTAVGVGAAGLVDRDGRIHYAPNIKALLDVPLRQRLQETLHLPVIVDNDANAAAWGEVVHGAAAGRRHALVVTLGTGIGGGIVLDGQVFRGAHGFAAEIGHFQVTEDGPECACGQTGHWEAVASGRALGRLGREWAARGDAPHVLTLAGDDPVAVEGTHVTRAALEGDPAALEIVAAYADLVAVGLAGLANVLDPEVVVVGGGVVTLGDALLGPLRDAFDRRIEASAWRPSVDILPAALGAHAGAIGAAALARDLGRRA